LPVLVVLLALGLSTSAGATPVVTASARIVPIRGFKGTGRLGQGAAVESKYTITGTEFPGGFPSPLTKAVVYLPEGTKLHPQGFSTCAASVLIASGPSACPKKSIASPVGKAGVADFIGGSPITETATLQAFFSPGGGLNFYANAEAPISAQIVSQGHFTKASAPYGLKFEAEVPLIEALPGAPDVSVTSIDVLVGAAYRKKGKTISYGTVPKKCPKGGFPAKSELTFHSGETVTQAYRVPCPKR
jgi:hypothetical protein